MNSNMDGATGDQAANQPQPVSPGQQVPPAPYGPQPVYIIQQPPTSGMAVASMVLAIIGLISSCCTFGIPSILAVIFGHVARSETKNGTRSGDGMAVAGLVMGYIITGPAIVWSVMTVIGGGIGAIAP